jgi:hypothetical protein
VSQDRPSGPAGWALVQPEKRALILASMASRSKSPTATRWRARAGSICRRNPRARRARRVADHVHLANRQAIGGALAGQQELQAALEGAIAGIVVQPLLGQHHPALFVHGVSAAASALRRFPAAASGWCRPCRRRSWAGPACRSSRPSWWTRWCRRRRPAVAFEDLDHLAGGHVGRSVEGHVLRKVRQALLGVDLHQRAGGDAQPQRRLAGRRGVVHQGVGHAVGQRPKRTVAGPASGRIAA